MADESELEEAIIDAAQKPSSATVDGRSATAQPLRDMIDADRYVEGKRAARKSSGWGIRFAKIVPPGAG